MDTDYHYIINTKTNNIYHNKESVIIGEGTWIASTCKIMKGSIIPKNSIISGGSLVNKDFSKEDPCQIYVGVPAKPIKGNSRRVFNVKRKMSLISTLNCILMKRIILWRLTIWMNCVCRIFSGKDNSVDCHEALCGTFTRKCKVYSW